MSTAPAQMQPAELEAELGLPLASTSQHDWRWMRICIMLQREVRYLRGAIEALEQATANLQKGYYVGPGKRTSS